MHVPPKDIQVRINDFKEQLNQFRKILFILLEDPSSSRLAGLIQFIICFTILLSQVQILCDSLFDNNQTYNDLSNNCEILIFVVFAIEYLLRLSTYTVYGYPLKAFLYQHMNIIDLLSIAPLSIISLMYGKTALNGFRILKLFKVIRILKIKRYLKGVDILYKSVADCISQFYFLIIAFLQITLAYAIVLYYSEHTENDLEIENAVWLGIVTMTTVGYGDYVPKSIIGIIVTCIMALMANTVIFSLPVAILNIEFQELYGSKKEAEQISLLKKSMRSGRRDSIKNKEFSFFNQRLQIIEERNKEIQDLLNKSNKMAKELTKDLKRLFLSVNDDADQLLDNLNSPRLTKQNVLLVKANLYDKLMRAKKKIQITNIFRNLIQDSDQEKNESPLNQTVSVKANKQKCIFRILADRKKNKKKIGLKSHSCENINQLIILKNEEYGELPFDFLNEVILQIHDDMFQDIDEHPMNQQQRSIFIPESSEIINKESSFRFNSLYGFDSPMVRLNQSNSGSPNQNQRKISDFTSLADKKSIINLKSAYIPPLFLHESGFRSITEKSNSKFKNSYTKQEIDEMHQKTKPRIPHQFVNYNNNLKDIDSGIKKNEFRKKQFKPSIVDFYSPHQIYLNIQDQCSCNECQKLQY
ncbi:unnamed protein product (macronuclear) [Paramecium tetraurelia]|uniref:Ion transport domain-containing protein n=1 Tax=Paramecium tetraurelia TaxID=5888 RepID=A0EAY6_PARTE|nr:uncharacterized protein GSPATT00025187001 [Paramecium tetraurelia]CAK92453.1 unnamed protein product [Paramecium tetraurelia]|eukprot:XP_001459850.1 hypothetical protein (macronuclear) [Paramecium tetraurelia strain d4-2]